jgi:hypothetical protein
MPKSPIPAAGEALPAALASQIIDITDELSVAIDFVGAAYMGARSLRLQEANSLCTVLATAEDKLDNVKDG